MKWLKVCLYAAIAWYVILATLHYCNQRPMWNDEECVFLSIHTFEPRDFFTKPLEALQQFPRVYILSIQTLSNLFHAHLLALRFLPYVAMILAFWVWFSIIRQEFKQGSLVIYVLSWCASIPLIYYAAELKQYSMDVLASGLVVLFLYKEPFHGRLPSGMRLVALLALPFLGLFSYPVFLLLGFPFYNLSKAALKDHRFWPLVWAYGGCCAVVAAFVYFFDMRASASSHIANYWMDHMIVLDSWKAFFKTFGTGMDNLFTRIFADQPKVIRRIAKVFMAAALIQMFACFWRSFKNEAFYVRRLRTLGLIILIEHLILAVAKLYPFGVTRTSLFMTPILLFLAIDGMNHLDSRVPILGKILKGAYVVFLLVISSGIAQAIFAGDLGAQQALWGLK